MLLNGQGSISIRFIEAPKKYLSKEQFKKINGDWRSMLLKPEIIDSLKRELKICDVAIKNYKRLLKKFENKYNMSSNEFFHKFENGIIGDDKIFFEWYAILEYYKDWVNKRKILQETVS